MMGNFLGDCQEKKVPKSMFAIVLLMCLIIRDSLKSVVRARLININQVSLGR